MPENLCNNEKTKYSIEGKTFKDPCDFWGCNYNNFNDWQSTLVDRLNISKNLYKRLEDTVAIDGNPALTLEEEEIWKKIKGYEQLVKDYSQTGDGLTHAQYKKIIDDLKVAISNVTCMIESIEKGIEDRGGTYVPSGIIEGSRSTVWGSSMVKWAVVGLVGYGAFMWINNKYGR